MLLAFLVHRADLVGEFHAANVRHPSLKRRKVILKPFAARLFDGLVKQRLDLGQHTCGKSVLRFGVHAGVQFADYSCNAVLADGVQRFRRHNAELVSPVAEHLVDARQCRRGFAVRGDVGIAQLTANRAGQVCGRDRLQSTVFHALQR